MYSTLGCVPKPGTSTDQYPDILGEVCGTGDICSEITSDGSTGYYGEYSMCNATQQLGYAIDRYYSAHGVRSSYCDFDGAASTQSAASPTGVCKDVLELASSSIASARSSNTGSSSGSGSGSSSDSGLSSGAKIGIGVGVGIGALLLIACLVALFLMRKRLKSQEARYQERYGAAPGEKDETRNEKTDPGAATPLANDIKRHEMESPRPELMSDRGDAELPGSHAHHEIGRSTTTGAKGRESRHEMSAINYGPVSEQWDEDVSR